jgi:hypothetical protein
VIESLETLKGYNTGVMPPISFGPQSHSGVKSFNWGVWHEGKLIELADQ